MQHQHVRASHSAGALHLQSSGYGCTTVCAGHNLQCHIYGTRKQKQWTKANGTIQPYSQVISTLIWDTTLYNKLKAYQPLTVQQDQIQRALPTIDANMMSL